MEQNFKPITKQLVIAALFLTSVTVLSFGIRQVRFSIYRAGISEPTSSARPLDTVDQSQPEQHLYANAELDYYPEDSYIVDAEDDSQDTEESFWDEQAPTDEYAEAKTDSIKKDIAFTKDKPFKGDYAKPEGKKGLQKISLGDYENLYVSEKGEAWYVSEQPDGDTLKMQVQINDFGELTPVSGGEYAKQDPQRIPIGNNEDIYLTDEGEAWYVSEQPDGDTLKIQVQMD